MAETTEKKARRPRTTYKLDVPFCRSVAPPESGNRIYIDAHEKAPPGFGLRVTSSGAKAWVLSYVVDRVQRRLTLPAGFPDWPPDTAREAARKLYLQIVDGTDPLEQRRAEQREHAEAREQRKRLAELTLGALCEAYADHLAAQGKTSARAVRAAMQRNVINAAPKIASKPAAVVTADDALELIEGLTDEGKLRQASKLRSYLRSAFAAAINAKRSPGALPALRAIGRTIESNPVRDVAAVPGANKTKDRTLDKPELRAYWSHIKAMNTPAGALLRFHLLTGAQRLEQLARATVADIDNDVHALRLLDPKGRRSEPRKHWVPLLPVARDTLAAMRGTGRGPFVFTLSHGKRAAMPSTVAQLLKRLSTELVDAGKVSAPFSAGDIRRTVETQLAALGVGLEVRAHLQSHGLGGVQARHYQRHDFAKEKRDALQRLLKLIEGTPAVVTPIRRAQA